MIWLNPRFRPVDVLGSTSESEESSQCTLSDGGAQPADLVAVRRPLATGDSTGEDDGKYSELV